MSEQAKILVIEDEDHIRLVVEYNLRLEGFDVYLAEDGPTGLRLAREIIPEVILLDWMLPGMDGLEVLAELKHDERMAGTLVFMLTARGAKSDMELALSVGADYYVLKPFNMTELSRTIRERLAQSNEASVGREDGRAGSRSKRVFRQSRG
ncbi:MAG: response regulator transcription factor [Planctomycetota bacterium]|jgi:DNA-binding response OmpR family regulator